VAADSSPSLSEQFDQAAADPATFAQAFEQLYKDTDEAGREKLTDKLADAIINVAASIKDQPDAAAIHAKYQAANTMIGILHTAQSHRNYTGQISGNAAFARSGGPRLDKVANALDKEVPKLLAAKEGKPTPAANALQNAANVLSSQAVSLEALANITKLTAPVPGFSLGGGGLKP
jgi:hypothetical protein